MPEYGYAAQSAELRITLCYEKTPVYQEQGNTEALAIPHTSQELMTILTEHLHSEFQGHFHNERNVSS